MILTIPNLPYLDEALAAYGFGTADRLYRAAHRTGDVVARKELLAQKRAVEKLNKKQLTAMYIQDLIQRDFENNVYENGKLCGTDTEINMTVSEQGKDDEYFSFGTVETLILRLRKYAQQADAATQDMLKKIEHDALRIDVNDITSAYEFTSGCTTYRIEFNKSCEGVVTL